MSDEKKPLLAGSSPAYDTFTSPSPPAPKIASAFSQDAQDPYLNRQRELLIASDKVYNIKSKFIGDVLDRDTSEETPLKKRIPPDRNIDLIAYNAELRTIGTLQGFSHILKYIAEQDPDEARRKLVDTHIRYLAERFKEFQREIKEARDAATEKNPEKLAKEVNRLQEAINLDLLRCAVCYPFLQDKIDDPQELGKFLAYCNFAAGSLHDAPSVRTTITLCERENDIPAIKYTETCQPVTAKLNEQKDGFRKAISDNEGFFKEMSPWQQTIILAFEDDFAKDGRSLSPQMRNLIPFFLKQAFVIKRELWEEGNPPKEIKHHWAGRTGTIAYVGPGADEDWASEPAQQNLKQFKNEKDRIIGDGKERTVHVKILNTDTDIWYRNIHKLFAWIPKIGKAIAKVLQKIFQDKTRQDLMVKRGNEAVDANPGCQLSVLGVNSEGRVAPPRISGRSTTPLRRVGMLGVFLGAMLFLLAPLWALLITTHSVSLVILLASSAVEMAFAVVLGILFAAVGIIVMKNSARIADLGNPLDPGSRILRAVEVGLSDDEITEIIVDSCASGIDRTATQALLFTIKWLVVEMQQLQQLRQASDQPYQHLRSLTEENITRLIVGAGHNAVMSHILCPGTPGMKNDSRPGDYFGSLAKFIYLRSAESNKEVPLYASQLKAQQRSGQIEGLIISAAALGLALVLILVSPAVFGSFMSVVHSLPVTGIPALVFALVSLGFLGILLLIHKKAKSSLVVRKFCKVMIGAVLVVNVVALAMSPLLIFLINGLFALGILTMIFKRYKKDWLNAAGWVIGTLVTIAIVAFIPLGEMFLAAPVTVGAVSAGIFLVAFIVNLLLAPHKNMVKRAKEILFRQIVIVLIIVVLVALPWLDVAAWAAFTSPTLFVPIFSLVLVSVTLLAFGREVGGAAGKAQAETDFLLALQEPLNMSKEMVPIQGLNVYAHAEFCRAAGSQRDLNEDLADALSNAASDNDHDVLSAVRSDHASPVLTSSPAPGSP